MAAGFGRHGMPSPASNDTGTALFPELRRGRDETYRQCELMTLIFDHGSHCDCQSYVSWYFVREPSTNHTVTRQCDQSSSSSRMCVMNHNWSATKHCLHPQSVAEISRHSILSADRIRQCGTSSGQAHREGGVAGGKCPGAPLKNLSWCEKR